MKKINFENVGNAFIAGSFIGLAGQIVVTPQDASYLAISISSSKFPFEKS